MPNHCYQQVYLRGPSHLIHHLHNALSKSEPEFCNTIAPMPFELWAKETQPDQVLPEWYKWRCENWGTKWDVCAVEIDDTYRSKTKDGLEYSHDKKVAWFAFRCWTAWNPPVPVWDRLHAMGIEVEAEYQDEGEMFEGAYKDGEESNWNIVHEEEEV